ERGLVRLGEEVVADERRDVVGRLGLLVVLKQDEVVHDDVRLGGAELPDINRLADEGPGHWGAARRELRRVRDIDAVRGLEGRTADRVRVTVAGDAELEL